MSTKPKRAPKYIYVAYRTGDSFANGATYAGASALRVYDNDICYVRVDKPKPKPRRTK